MALRGILEHENLELVGLLAASPEKIGLDVGEILGIAPTRIIATNDIDALVALKPDCFSYFAGAIGREDEAVDQLSAFLCAGTNVVSTSMFSLIDPATSPEIDLVRKLEAACREGGSSMFNSGIEPGFATVHLPATLASLCSEVELLRITEFFNYNSYPVKLIIQDLFGFGLAKDQLPGLFNTELPGSYDKMWGPSIHLLGRILGREIDEIRLVTDFWLAEEPFDMRACHVPKDHIGGIRFEIQGMVGGKPFIIVEHVNYGSDHHPPHWERPVTGNGTYRVTIKGKPNIINSMSFGGEGDEPNVAGRIATAMHTINAIPGVCAAPAGILTIADLPLYASRSKARP
ncbi:NAD(P)H-dependent amine dehydrogenase family protein [Tardibacter chloracetimidivorans]|uniref:NAD(P)H-dependent amine dehydrogenase family protein n=1 Tax=Tardibacter chloracetimidivorans TaxID=1921510 RepID=UPI0009F9E772|nr:hypothetical protein [Tardibacter chloracetimidivorans]